MPDLRGRRCLITGAASGIGRATALAAARRGAVLYLTDIQAEASRRSPRRSRAAGGAGRLSEAADITDHDAVVALAAEIHAAHGSMDVVMNIAGISTWGTIERPRAQPLAADGRRQPDGPDPACSSASCRR